MLKILTIFFFSLFSSQVFSVIVVPEVNKKARPSAKLTTIAPQDTSISREAIKESTVSSVSTLLRQQQSVARLVNNSVDNSQAAISIRGFGDNASANSLILINGFPLTNPTLLAPNINAIALLDVSKINITQGSEGVLAGDQAVGGVVNLSTRQVNRLLLDGMTTLGSYNKKLISTLIGNEFSSGFFIKAVGLFDTTNHYRQHNQQINENFRSELGFNYPSGTLQLFLQAYENRIDFSGGLTAAQFLENPRQATTLNNFVFYKSQLYQFLSKHAFNSNLVLETRLSKQLTRANGFIFFPSEMTLEQCYVEPRLIGNMDRISVTVGIFAQNGQYQLSNRLIKSNAITQQQNIFAQMNFKQIPKINFILGGRYAWQSNNTHKLIDTQKHDNIFVSEQGVIYKITPAWQFNLRQSGSFRFPKANELMQTVCTNHNLAAQQGHSFESGLSWLTYRSQTKVNIYKLLIKNEILYDPTQSVGFPFGAYSNIPLTKRDGVGLSEIINFTPRLKLNAQFNYVDARFATGRFSNKVMPAVPRFNANLNFNYEFIPNGYFKYYLIYTGRRFASQDNYNIGKPLPGYAIHSCSLQYIIQHYNFSIEANNLFNKVYSSYTYFNSTDHSLTFYPGDGRSIFFTITANLEK